MSSTVRQQNEIVSSIASNPNSLSSDILPAPTQLSFLKSNDVTLTWLTTNQLTKCAQRVSSEPNPDLSLLSSHRSKRNHHPYLSISISLSHHSHLGFLSSLNSDHQSSSIKHLRVRSCPERKTKISASQDGVGFEEIQRDHSSGPQRTGQLVDYVVPFSSADLAWPNEYQPSEAELDSTSSSSARSSITTLELDTPSSNTFFDPDVTFPLPVPSLNPLKDSSLVQEVVWEDRAHHRILMMMEKESRDSLETPDFCRIHWEARHEVINWLLKFDLRLDDYPCIAPATRHRAITLFSNFWSQDSLSGSMLLDDVRLVARRTGVTCLELACKVDVDELQPLFDVPLSTWAKQVTASGWTSANVKCLESYERTLLRQLSYNVTAPTPFDFMSELTIASFELVRLMNHCPEEWELIEEAFKIVLERTVQSPEYIKYPTSVLTAAALFLSLEGCLFDHPLEKSDVKGRQWSRDSDGTWTESIKLNVPKTVRVHVVSEVLSDMSIEVVQEDIKASVCAIMRLDQREVEECQNWCASL